MDRARLWPLTSSVLKRDSISAGISVTGAARLAGRATDSQQLPHLHSYRLPPGYQDVLAAAHPEKRMWTRRLSIPRELFTDRRQINLLQDSSKVDLGHPRSDEVPGQLQGNPGAAVQHEGDADRVANPRECVQ